MSPDDLPSRKDNPPINWGISGVKSLGRDVYFQFRDDDDHPYVWHFCEHFNRWFCAHTGLHQVLSRDPLTLAPSLKCVNGEGCSWHGFIRNGKWEPC